MTGRGRGRGRGRGVSKAALPPSLQPQLYSTVLPPPSATTTSSSGAAISTHPIATATSQNVPLLTYPEYSFSLPAEELTFQQKSWISAYNTLNQLIESSPYHLKNRPISSDLQRYSDRYKQDTFGVFRIHDIKADIQSFPEELAAIYKPDKARSHTKVSHQATSLLELLNLDELEKKEMIKGMAEVKSLSTPVTTEKGAGSGNDEDIQDETYEHEEFEEENDYNCNYFDPGDDYGDEEYGDDGGAYY